MSNWFTYMARLKNGGLKVGVTRNIFEQLVQDDPLVWYRQTSTKREATVEKTRLAFLTDEEREALLPWYTINPDFRKANALLKHYLNVTPPPINGMNRDEYRSWLGSVHMSVRGPLVRRYAWAIPTEEAIQTIIEFGPIVEMGAGTGYWAHLVQLMGGDVIAYDPNPPSKETSLENLNIWHSDTTFFNVLTAGPEALNKHSDRALLLCWPPDDSAMATECLAEWEGDIVIYVGDRKVTADPSFFELLDNHFCITRVVSIPQWAGVDDRMIIWRRLA